MKKKTLVLFLSLTLSILLFGCGNTETAIKEEETQPTQEQKQEEEKQEDNVKKEPATNEIDGDIVFYSELPKYGDYILNELEFETVEEFEVTSVNELPVYSTDGINVGYVKNGITITINEKGVNSAWYHFLNPVNGTDYEYLFVSKPDISDYAKASNAYTSAEYWAKVREELDIMEQESQELYDQFLAENPNFDLSNVTPALKIVTATSPDELTTDGSIMALSLLKTDCDNGSIHATATTLFSNYEEYYIEVTREEYGYIEYHVYGKKRE